MNVYAARCFIIRTKTQITFQSNEICDEKICSNEIQNKQLTAVTHMQITQVVYIRRNIVFASFTLINNYSCHCGYKCIYVCT